MINDPDDVQMPDAANAANTEHRFVFSGSGAEYFRIWIVNLLLTIVTLGIYGAWAKVRRQRYFYGHTTLAGSSFEYHGQPKQILIGRLIALALIVPYYILQFWQPLWSLAFLLLFLIALPFILVRSQRFHLRVSSWRNVRFNFIGTYGGAAAAYLGWGLLTLLSLGLLAPYADYQRQRFKIAHSRFGGVPFSFAARPGRFYIAYLVALGYGLLAVFAFAVLMGVLAVLAFGVLGLGASVPNLREVFTNPTLSAKLPLFIAALFLVYVGYIIVLFIPYAVAKARTTNESLGNTTLGVHGLTSSLQGRGLLGVLVANLLLVLFTLGLYAPWARVRLVRYQLDHTSLRARGNLDEFINEPAVQTGAAAQELSDFMDLDFGL